MSHDNATPYSPSRSERLAERLTDRRLTRPLPWIAALLLLTAIGLSVWLRQGDPVTEALDLLLLVCCTTLGLIVWLGVVNERHRLDADRAQRRLSALVEHGDDVTVVFDRQARLTWVSPSVSRVTGFSPEESLGIDLFATVHHDDWQQVREVWRHMLREPHLRLRLHYRVFTKDRGWIPTEGLISGHFEDDGVNGAVIVFHDISERVQREAELKRSEDMLNRAQAIARMGSWEYIARPAPVSFSMSREARNILGLAPDEKLTLRDTLSFVHPDDREAVRQAWLAALAGEEFDLGHRVLIHGETLWVHTRVELRFDEKNELQGAIGAVQDVSAQNLAATHLAELLDFNEKIIAESSIGIAVIDGEGPCILANEALARILGGTVDDLLHINFHEAALWKENGIYEAALRALQSGEMVRHRTRGKSLFGRNAALENEFNLVYRQGRPHLLLLVKDVTEFEEAEATLREGQRLAEEANRAKSEFLANMTHEIRTPMNAVIGLAQVVLERTSDPSLRDYLQQIYTSATMLLAIINDILDYSKIEAGRLHVERHEFAVRDITARTIGMFRQSAGNKALQLKTMIADDVPARLIGDSTRIAQIIINLVDNAIKFTEHGDVSLSIQCRPEKGFHAASADFPPQTVLVEFAVADTGIGMTTDELDRLFRPFVQADGSITRRYGGTGLGLTISRRLAQLMGGGIDTSSTHGAGSCFTLWLPLGTGTKHEPVGGAKDGAAFDSPARPTLATRAARIAGAHILLVEDDEINRSVITRVLTQAGLRVTAAEHGVAALRRLAASTFDAVLLDLLMPEMDGFETITAIRANTAWSGLPVIAITAATLIHDADSCLNAGMNDYLAKPVQPLMLIDTLLRHVAARERSTEQPVPTNSIEQGQLLDRLSNLQGRLANNDFISVGELSELREGLSSIAGARAARLEAAISRYDYKEARAVLAELMTSVCAATDL